ncbi:MAG: hypothetical protein PWP24_303 [Clostridiales bacterium]|nr:hypothetical protein [Clostridiales bacterium]
MRVEQFKYEENEWEKQAALKDCAQWVLVFGDHDRIVDGQCIQRIRACYPNAYLMGCTTAGEIHNDNTVCQNSVSITAIQFEKSSIACKSFSINPQQDSKEVGIAITAAINKEGLRHIFVLSEGVNINGSRLVEGMRELIGNEIPITGGLAGDGSRFEETFVVNNDQVLPNQIVVAALYGNIITSCASFGGWDTFGIERLVTKSKDNILYEMDEKPALLLYKEYLGEKAKDLPSSGLLFPLSVRIKENDQTLVRTLLGINEEDNSLIFAGDIPVNSYCRLMKANHHHLIDAASSAAAMAKQLLETKKTNLAILISCVGRRLVLKQQADFEIEAVRKIIGEEALICGFYSYGEIAPHSKNTECELHNQTMTLTLLSEEGVD